MGPTVICLNFLIKSEKGIIFIHCFSQALTDFGKCANVLILENVQMFDSEKCENVETL